MESERRINWLSLFIKIIIIFIFVLIIIWLVSKIISRNKLSDTFTNNINNMETVAVDYFKTIDLPLEKGQSIKITLDELIDKKLIVSVNQNGDNICNVNESYSKITRETKNYIVETTLICGKEKNTITKKFSLKDCKNCNQSTTTKEENKNTENKQKENSNNTESNTTTSNNTSSKVTYYEQVKETTTYSNWMRGSKTGSNIENKYEYYGIAKETYFSLGYVKKDNLNKKTTITYTLKLNNVPNNKYYFTTIEDSSYFDSTIEKDYLNETKVSLNKLTSSSIPENIENYSLKENNFTYKLLPYYRKGSFYIDVIIEIKNTENVKSYYDNKLKSDIYYIPIKINVKFASNQITETKPSGDYDTITYYRYVETVKNTIWSTEQYVEGYTRTGNTRQN